MPFLVRQGSSEVEASQRRGRVLAGDSPQENHVPAPRTYLGTQKLWLYLPCYFLPDLLRAVDIFIACMPIAVSFRMRVTFRQ